MAQKTKKRIRLTTKKEAFKLPNKRVPREDELKKRTWER